MCAEPEYLAPRSGFRSTQGVESVINIDRQLHRVGPIITIPFHRVPSRSRYVVSPPRREQSAYQLLHATTYYGRIQKRIVDVHLRDPTKRILEDPPGYCGCWSAILSTYRRNRNSY